MLFLRVDLFQLFCCPIYTMNNHPSIQHGIEGKELLAVIG